ncbi:MAG: hypothetical protein ABJC74_00670 [Gemmatimonadota bacterium]
MPAISVRLIRSALLCLVAGAGLGALLLAAPQSGTHGWWRAHAELMLLGWTGQLALGVAYWILPKHATGHARGAESLARGIHPLLNAGLLLGVSAWGLGLPGWVLAASRLLESAAIGSFVLVAWPRVKPFGIGRQGR